MAAADGGRPSAPEGAPGRGVLFLRNAAFVVVVVAGLKLAASLLVPLVVSAFLAVACVPAVRFFEARRVPTPLAVVLTLVLVLGAMLVLSLLVVDSLSELSDVLPTYRDRLKALVDDAGRWLEDQGIEFARRREKLPVDPDAAVRVLTQAAGTVVNAFSAVFLVLLLLLFMISEASGLPAKIRLALGRPESDLARFHEVTGKVLQYLGVKTVLSLLTGVLWGAFLAAVGVPFALLWGVLAFLLNFIPNIGSVLSMVPPVLLTLLDRGAGAAGLLVVVNLVLNQATGTLVEPRLMGARLGLSPCVVFLSLLFWAWVWGPVGMLLSAPLTMVLKILLESSEDLRPVAVLLGPAPAHASARSAPRSPPLPT